MSDSMDYRSRTPWTIGYIRLLGPWDFPGKSTGVGCHFLHQIISKKATLETVSVIV